MKTFFLFLTVFFFLNCSEKRPHEISNSDQPEYSFEHILNYNNEDTIFIKSQFSDCGEWGGHEELIKVYRSEKRIKLSYVKFEADCEMRDSVSLIVQQEKRNIEILLTNPQQEALMNYINNLLKFKFLDHEMSHSGNVFSVNNTKEDFKISQFGNQSLLLDNYNTLMTVLRFPKVKVNNK
ncbi:hypothetical protein [Chryseobacterium echinoideorum]|uniref:hypothetical protein n=1 Tax=Chryseobacterium echinoideorum TaxID=1549648 RepID=UPI00118475E9|nr:hypothetical protein [Chryseobacterium echinoideorum]